MKQKSIARRLTKRIFLLLLLAFLILYAGSAAIVYQAVKDTNRAYARAVGTIYGDLINYRSVQEGVPVDLEHADIADWAGAYICQWYNVDYVSLSQPDTEKNIVTFLSMQSKGHEAEISDHWRGSVFSYVLEPEEKAVWDGEQTFAHIPTEEDRGHVISTLLRLDDRFGNRYLISIDVAYQDVYDKAAGYFVISGLVILAVLLAVYFVVYFIIRKQVSKPAKIISTSMQDYVAGGKRVPMRLETTGVKEYATISDAFNQMTYNIDTYLANINTLNREKERQHAEEDIAARIQRGFLPKEALTTPCYAIRATMEPARNIGGDLYDYVTLDNHRVLVVIADVSGKGFSAAMFMSVILILIRQFAKLDLPPEEILRRTNDSVSEENAAMLFATAFVGIYDSEAKTLTYSNAGHNLPYVLGDTLTKLDGARGTLLGLFPGERYESATARLKSGDLLLLYTDGVTEATNEAREFYGEARLEETLRESIRDMEPDTLARVRRSVQDFAGSAEQHDDMTMLTLQVVDSVELDLKPVITEQARINSAILSLPMPRRWQLELCLAAEERFVNICTHAYPQGAPPGERVHFTLTQTDHVTMQFEDHGRPFDPLERIADPDEYDIDTQIGGLGNFLSKSSVDDMKYEYRDGKNILTFTKYFEEEST